MGWKSNEGKSRCYCAAVDCAPPSPPSLLTVSPEQDRCSVCMPPAFPTSIFLPGIPDYCSICLIVVSECHLFVQCDALEVGASIQNVWNTPELPGKICKVEQCPLKAERLSAHLNFLLISWSLRESQPQPAPLFFEKKACKMPQQQATRNRLFREKGKKGQRNQGKDTKKRDRERKTDSSSQSIRGGGDGGERAREGDVTVNQHFALLPPGPHVAHRHSRTWRGTV